MKIKEITKGKLSVKDIAALTGLTVQAIYKWERAGVIPAEYCRTIEFASEGAVSRYELRPDVFGETVKEAAGYA